MSLWQTLAALAGGALACASYYMGWYTERGVLGAQKACPSLRIPDMRFHYGASELAQTFEVLGPENRGKLLYFWKTDDLFILGLWAVMFFTPFNVTQKALVIAAMQASATVRGLLDALENLLLSRCCRAYPAQSRRMSSLAGWVTTLKFCALILWVALLFAALALRALHVWE